MTTKKQQKNILRCKKCDAILPFSATFCGKCGERTLAAQAAEGLSRSKQLIAGRYRITALIRRNPSIRLSVAIDTQQQRPVIIRDIDISALSDVDRARASAAFHQEYELLRRQRIPDLLPFIATHGFQGHLYSISGRAGSTMESDERNGPSQARIDTMQDLLQSGIGLPPVPIAVAWGARLADVLTWLHRHDIVYEDLDPDCIACSTGDYSGEPALMAAWLPRQIRQILPQASNTTNTRNFVAPEVLQGGAEVRSDIYSLGAILYLLLSGHPPEPIDSTESSHHALRSLHDINPQVSHALDAVVQQALAPDPARRFQNAEELAEALRHPESKQDATRRVHLPFARPVSSPESSKQDVEEKPISSDKDTNDTEKSTDAQPSSEPDGETIRVVPLNKQAQLARRHLSNVPTQTLGIQEKQSGEAGVKKVHTTEDIVGNAVLEDDTLITSPRDGKGDKRVQSEKQQSEERKGEEVRPEATEAVEVKKPDASAQNGLHDSSATVRVPELNTSISQVAPVKKPDDEQSGQNGQSEQSIQQAEVERREFIEAQDTVLIQGAQLVQAARAASKVSSTSEVVVEPEQDEYEQEQEEDVALLATTTLATMPASKVQEVNKEEDEDVPTLDLTPKKVAPSAVKPERGKVAQPVRDKTPTVEKTLVPDTPKESSAGTEAPSQPEVYDIPTIRISQAEVKAGQEEYLKQKQQERAAEQAAVERSRSDGQLGEKVESRALVPAPPEQKQLEKVEDKDNPLARFKTMLSGSLPPLPRLMQTTGMPDTLQQEQKSAGKTTSFLRQVKRFILGEQQHRTAAAALIETPMRVQPNQSYAIRIHVMGREEPRDGEQSAGLSALVQGDTVHIEVRSALYQNYAYIVQQADVEVPAVGFAAEVTMPMRPFTKGPSSRRERLHIFFMDAERNPLYEKPFVIELFISPLVQSGREGHNVLSIPL